MLDGKPIKVRSAGEAIRHGIVLCPEDRKEEGIVAMATVSENINISCRRHYLRAGLFLDRKKEAETADRFIKLLKIKTPSRRQKIRFLSGGNQQKAILSRWLAEPDLKVVILDEPTRGIDVGAKHEIYNVIYQLAERGCAIVMISSELPEVLGVSDRIVVMRQGRISGELPRSEANGTSGVEPRVAAKLDRTARTDAAPAGGLNTYRTQVRQPVGEREESSNASQRKPRATGRQRRRRSADSADATTSRNGGSRSPSTA